MKPSTHSPTGYWAYVSWTDEHYALLEKVARTVAERDGTPYRKPRSVIVVPVVTWTPEGWAAVFNQEGKLTPVNNYPGAKVFVDHEPLDA